jgi:hypothetical protein
MVPDVFWIFKNKCQLIELIENSCLETKIKPELIVITYKQYLDMKDKEKDYCIFNI